MQSNTIKESLKDWRTIVKKYQEPSAKKASIQLLTSFVPFVGLWVLMYYSLDWSYLITLGLAGIAAFFLVRIFIIQHDCGHQSFFKSRKANNIIGLVSSFFSTIPYKYWSRTHTEHHAHNAQMEYRGIGDIHFLTTEEFKNMSLFGKIKYYIFRSPLVLFLIAPIVYITVRLRYPFIKLKGWKKIRWSHILNNTLLVAIYVSLAYLLDWQKFMMIQIPIIIIFGTIAFWFFYVQHQHEDNYRELKENWDHLLASIKGSTYYKLPRLFQWLSGNIGFHHIHHLNSRIPNYNLEACAVENPILNKYVHQMGFKQSLSYISHKLWDEKQQRMISFREYWNSNK